MPRDFNVPAFYRSDLVQVIKATRATRDPKKKDRSPSILDFGSVRFKIARHFGFCFGVENAIEIAYRVIDENPGKRVFLLSEVIHNPLVNSDLESRGIHFLMKTDGTRLIDFSTLSKESSDSSLALINIKSYFCLKQPSSRASWKDISNKVNFLDYPRESWILIKGVVCKYFLKRDSVNR